MSEQSSILKKQIKIGKDAYPTKTSMNFVVDTQAVTNKRSIIGFIIFIIALLLFTKFGVIDTISNTSKLQSDYNSLASSNSSLEESLENYDSVLAQYNEKVGDFLTDEEKSCLNRNDILKLLNDDVFPFVSVTNFSVQENDISVYTGVTDLNTVSKILSKLQEDDRTSYVTVTRTLADSNDDSKVTADISITYKTEEGGNE